MYSLLLLIFHLLFLLLELLLLGLQLLELLFLLQHRVGFLLLLNLFFLPKFDGVLDSQHLLLGGFCALGLVLVESLSLLAEDLELSLLGGVLTPVFGFLLCFLGLEPLLKFLLLLFLVLFLHLFDNFLDHCFLFGFHFLLELFLLGHH